LHVKKKISLKKLHISWYDHSWHLSPPHSNQRY